MKRHRFSPAVVGAGILLLAAFSSCTHDPVGVETQPEVCFSTDVLPVIQANCAKSGCHAGGSAIDLGTGTAILRYVTPFKPGESRLYTAITSTWFQPMPPSPNPPLNKTQRTTIALWILQGASLSCGS